MYAERTSVPVDRSQVEIQRLLARYGADQYMFGTEARGSFIAFRARSRVVRFVVPMPTEREMSRTPGGRTRRGAAVVEAMEQEARRRWRALALCIKAKLEAVASGITTFETEFLPYTMLANGKTVAEHVGPAIEDGLRRNALPTLPLIGGPTDGGA